MGIGVGLGSVGAIIAGQRGAMGIRAGSLFLIPMSATIGVIGGLFQNPNRELADLPPAILGEWAASGVSAILAVANGAALVETGFGMYNSEGPLYPQLVFSVGMVALQAALHIYNNPQNLSAQSRATEAFVHAVIHNDLSSLQRLSPEMLEEIQSNYVNIMPEGIRRFFQTMIEQLIRSPNVATVRNTPVFLHEVLGQINSLQVAFGQLEANERESFSLIQPLPKHSASQGLQDLYGQGIGLAGKMFTAPQGSSGIFESFARL